MFNPTTAIFVVAIGVFVGYFFDGKKKNHDMVWVGIFILLLTPGLIGAKYGFNWGVAGLIEVIAGIGLYKMFFHQMFKGSHVLGQQNKNVNDLEPDTIPQERHVEDLMKIVNMDDKQILDLMKAYERGKDAWIRRDFDTAMKDWELIEKHEYSGQELFEAKSAEDLDYPKKLKEAKLNLEEKIINEEQYAKIEQKLYEDHYYKVQQMVLVEMNEKMSKKVREISRSKKT